MTEFSLPKEHSLRKAFKEFLDKNIWIDDNGNIFSQWKEGIDFEMSEETRKIITDLYFESSNEIVPPKPAKNLRKR